MSTFECPVVRIEKVLPHPNADRLDLVYFRDFAVISQKGLRKIGDLVVYCPQDSIIPEYLLKQGFFKYDVAIDYEATNVSHDFKNPGTNHPESLSVLPPDIDLSTPGTTVLPNGISVTVMNTGKGMLAGSNGDRVKPIKLRGILSEGIMFPVFYEMENDTGEDTYYIFNHNHEIRFVKEGDNVADFLGITKYEPVLPASMSGDMVYLGTNIIPKFDIENIKKFDQILKENDDLVVSEKLHGTFFGVGYVVGLNHPDLWHGDFFCYSKGNGNKGLVFKNTENNKSNIYVKQFEKLLPKLKEIADRTKENEIIPSPKFFMGEIFGKGVQDLDYNSKEADFRLFDVYSSGSYTSWDDVVSTAKNLGVKTVPVLFEGLYKDYTTSIRDGQSTLAKHVKEGVVIKTKVPRNDKYIGRVILKDINPAYLTRKGSVTEFQ